MSDNETDGRPCTLSILDCIDRLNILRAAHMRKSMEQSGMHFRQIPILTFVRANPGCTQQELSAAMGLSPSSIALSTKRLEKGGFLQKKTDEENLRRKQLYLTENGRRALLQAQSGARAFNAVLMRGVTSEESAAAEKVLRRMIRNLCGDDRVDFMENIAMLHREESFSPDEADR